MYGSSRVSGKRESVRRGEGTRPSDNKMKKRKTPKMKRSEVFESKRLSKAQMDRLKEHAKMHKGGMASKHMRNMKKFMMAGDSFSKAHNKAMKEDKKK